MDRGWTPLDADGIGPELAAALKAEARRRVQAGSFFGYIAYAGLTARKRAGREMTAGACQASDLGFCCGAGGIRTPGTLACPAAFKAAAINQTLPPLQPGSPRSGDREASVQALLSKYPEPSVARIYSAPRAPYGTSCMEYPPDRARAWRG